MNAFLELEKLLSLAKYFLFYLIATGAVEHVEMLHLFSGSALREVDRDGKLALPAFVTTAVERRSGARALLFGKHESAPCVTAYDPAYTPVLHGEIERQRLRLEAAGEPPEAHQAR